MNHNILRKIVIKSLTLHPHPLAIIMKDFHREAHKALHGIKNNYYEKYNDRLYILKSIREKYGIYDFSLLSTILKSRCNYKLEVLSTLYRESIEKYNDYYLIKLLGFKQCQKCHKYLDWSTTDLFSERIHPQHNCPYERPLWKRIIRAIW